MQLPKDSLIAQWAFLAEPVPARTSLCAMFWRTVLITPICKIAGPVAAVVFLLSRFWFYPKPSFSFAGVVALVAAAFKFANWLHERKQMRKYMRPYKEPSPSVIRDGFKAIKGKVCPLVDLT